MASWVLLGLGFNGYQQLIPRTAKNQPHQETRNSLSLSTPAPLLTLSSETQPEVNISGTWDSLHIMAGSIKNPVVFTAGRWEAVLSDSKLAKHKISNVCEIGHKMVLKTDSKVLMVIRHPQNNEELVIHEQELSEICCFSSLEDESLYALTENGQLHLCTLLPVNTDIAKERIFLSPRLPTAGIPITKVSCGTDHVLILTSTGSLFSFGLNSRGQLGHADIETKTQPTLIAALDGLAIKDIACGHWHCLALSVIGDVYSWGWNKHQQLGHSEDNGTVTIPTLVVFEHEDMDIVAISCGSKHSVVLSEGGEVYGWGWNTYGQLGGVEGQIITQPKCIELPGALKPVHVCCIYWNTLILCEKNPLNVLPSKAT